MKITYWVYAHKSGEIRSSKDRMPCFDSNVEWVEIKHSLEIPNHMFEKATTTVNIDVKDKFPEPSAVKTEVAISQNLGQAELRGRV